MTEHTIYLIGGEDDESGTLVVDTANAVCRLKFRYRNQEIESTAPDYFEALCKLRLVLEKECLIPFCYGASLNVYPSGMCRDMGNGLMAYKLQAGKKPTRNDLVRIFEQGHDVIPASVANQKEFFSEWLKSEKV